MGRKKVVRDLQEELEIESKLLIDEAANLMKLHNYTKAMSIYQKVLTIYPVQRYRKAFSFPMPYYRAYIFTNTDHLIQTFCEAFKQKLFPRLIFTFQERLVIFVSQTCIYHTSKENNSSIKCVV